MIGPGVGERDDEADGEDPTILIALMQSRDWILVDENETCGFNIRRIHLVPSTSEFRSHIEERVHPRSSRATVDRKCTTQRRLCSARDSSVQGCGSMDGSSEASTRREITTTMVGVGERTKDEGSILQP